MSRILPARAAFVMAVALAAATVHAQDSGNLFDDPFVQVTDGFKGCPRPMGPNITREDFRKQEHVRAQHGFSCHRSGRCRLPNSYLYDREIIPRVAQFIRADGRFADTSVWVLGERRIVTLMGCVQNREQSEALERAVSLVDDVMNVVNELSVGTGEKPRYEVKP